MKHHHPDSAHRITFGLGVIALACTLAACGGDTTLARNDPPAYLGSIKQTAYDGNTDDLLTAGLGKTGIQQASLALAVSTAVPGALPFADPNLPTAVELRRATIYNRYRSILDMTPEGGFGILYGPNVTSAGVVTAGEGKVAGTEFIGFSDDGSGTKNVTMMVQLPASFDPLNPCIITATSSGSQGVYGALSTGEWGLKKGCAVAYTDKGTGTAPHDLQNDTVPLIDGTRTTSAAAGMNAAFQAPLTAAELAAFNTATPNRFAFKHAHSQQNPERDWGRYTLQAIEFAFYVINEKFGAIDASGDRLKSYVPGNTIVIASSVSNGGGAALAAAEQDTLGLIGGVAVAEPAVELPASPGVSV